MTIAEREQQILRVKEQSFQPEIEEALEQKLREGVLEVVKMTLEASVVEEVKVSLADMGDQKPRRSGFFQRTLDTQYGHIADLKVPKLRHSNQKRQWSILERYQRCLSNLFNWICCLYVMGLSLRDLQEALYPLLGHVLSDNAVNHITLKIQQQVDKKKLAPLPSTPQIILVDGVWVEILYTTEETKIDRAGHERQCRQAQERVVLAAMAVWADSSYSILHDEIANSETEPAWSNFFENMITKGLDVNAVELVVSDGTTGLPAVIEKKLPHAQQQRLERLFREFRTKSDEIGTFPKEISCLTVFFLVMQRDHAKHNRFPMAKTS